MNERYIVATVSGAEYDDVYTVSYEGRIVCTLSVKAEAKVVAQALEEAYDEGAQEGYSHGVTWGSESQL